MNMGDIQSLQESQARIRIGENFLQKMPEIATQRYEARKAPACFIPSHTGWTIWTVTTCGFLPRPPYPPRAAGSQGRIEPPIFARSAGWQLSKRSRARQVRRRRPDELRKDAPELGASASAFPSPPLLSDMESRELLPRCVPYSQLNNFSGQCVRGVCSLRLLRLGERGHVLQRPVHRP